MSDKSLIDLIKESKTIKRKELKKISFQELKNFYEFLGEFLEKAEIAENQKELKKIQKEIEALKEKEKTLIEKES